MWDFPLFPQSASTHAPKVDAVYIGLMIVSAAFTLSFAFFVLYFAVKYRRGSRADRSGIQDSNPIAEAVYITVPTLLGIGLFVWGALVYFELVSPPGDAVDIYVIGKQWMWKAQHPEGSKEINELHVPVGQPVRLVMTSQDVIHSFYIPAFRVKQDVLPGRYTTLWFQPTKVGRYRLFCAEYCGAEHSRMGGWVTVMEPSEYEEWLEGSSEQTGMAVAGEALFRQYHCSGCHGGNSTVKAPPLEGVFGGPVPLLNDPADPNSGVRIIQADERYLRDSILRPKDEVVAGYEPLMPSFEGQIPEEDMLKLVAYIKSIGRGRTTRPTTDRGMQDGEGAPSNITEIMGMGTGNGGDAR
ncbi:cytochrome c oxidase subunit II [Tautonia sociabilis]|uniref:cytochrome-c oxidase n=1 Tax=Tautonia sociabilis TaxID=2080755 RepID=A0A432MQ19_9BACT|nr:cytochrome c oxidase subunit II [Tautonia sociabilis]RUL89571.1 cytochrome c oxidase subunit II [Tautonia sociabilis]